MNMTEESKSRWEGETSVEVQGMSAEEVWPLLEDFCNLQKLIPIETCFQVEGVSGQPGLIRYCATTRDDGDPLIKWAKEKLLMLDPIQHCLIYEVVDSNMGFKSYVATLKVLPVTIITGDKPKPTGCKIQWSFTCDPVDGWTFDGLFSYIQFLLQSMAKKMELACSHQDKSL